MDDKTFDQKTAQDWIESIEKSGASLREQDIYPRLNQWLQSNNAKNVADIGCGQGICSSKISNEIQQYIGIDPSLFMVNRANQLYGEGNRKFLEGNIYDLPLDDSTVDSVFSILVWHLLENIAKASSELSRILGPEGRFLIITANPNAYEKWIAMYPDAQITGKKLEGTMNLNGLPSKDTLYMHSISEITTTLEKSKLKVLKTDEFRSNATSDNIKMLLQIEGIKTTP